MTTLASLTNLGGPDLIIILLIVLVLFGAKRLPDLAKGMGQAMREFHKAKDEFGQELNSATTAETTTVRTPPNVVSAAATLPDRPAAEPVMDPAAERSDTVRPRSS